MPAGFLFVEKNLLFFDKFILIFNLSYGIVASEDIPDKEERKYETFQ